MQDVDIRLATSVDAESIADAHMDSIRSLGSLFYAANIIEAWEGLRECSTYVRAMERGVTFFIATESETGKVIGFSSETVHENKHRIAVFVRGSNARQGIGGTLFRRAEEHAVQQRAESIHISASIGAVQFYERMGFVNDGDGEHALANGNKMACVFMHKDLVG